MRPEPLEQAPDEVLLRNALQGQQAAWDDLVHRYHGRGVRYVRQQLDDPYLAQDVLQAVWVDVVRSVRQ